MRRFIGGWMIVMALAMFGANASANDNVQYKMRTVIVLSSAVIEGDLTRPEGSYIVNRKLSKFSDLIQDRQDFIPELMSSHNDL